MLLYYIVVVISYFLFLTSIDNENCKADHQNHKSYVCELDIFVPLDICTCDDDDVDAASDATR